MASIVNGKVVANLSGHHLRVSVPVQFPRQLLGDPKVVINLSGFEIKNQPNAKLSVHAENITFNGFNAVFEVSGLGFFQQTAEYIAYSL